MYAYKYTSPSVSAVFGGAGLSAGIYPSNSAGTRTYHSSGTNEYTDTAFDATYDLYWFEVDSEGVHYPVQSSLSNALSAGVNTAIPIVSTHGNPTVNVIMRLATTVVLDQSSGIAIGSDPTLTASISGGAWNSDSSDASNKITFTGSPYAEGDNTVTAVQTDPNGDTTISTAIVVSYFSTAPIVEIDGQDITTDIESESYEVDVVYLYGGSLIEHGGVQVTHIGEVAYYGGTLITVNNYALLPTQNLVQIVGLTDGYGTSFSTTQELATKIPAIVYTGLTTIDAETYGTSYAATGTIDVDTGAPYQELAKTPSEAPYTFSLPYEVKNFTASYEYPTATGVSNSIPVAIDYVEFANIALLTEKINDGVDIWIDGETTTKIGTKSLGLVGSPTLGDNQTDNVLLSADNDYKTAYMPKLGKNIDSTVGGVGCEILDSSTLFGPTENYTLSFTEKNILAGGIQFAYAKGVSSEGFGEVHGMYYSSNEVAFRWYGTNINTGYFKTAIVNNYIIVNDADNDLFKLYVNGDLKSTTDTSSMTPNTNGYNVAFQGYFTDSDADTLGFSNKSELTNIRVANYAFNDADAFAEYRNPCKGPTVVATGDSNLAFGTDDNYFNQVFPALVDENICGNTVRLGRAGATFYESVRSGYTYKVADGGYVPDIESRPSPDVARNMDYIRDYIKADIIHFLYTGNYTQPNPAYVYGENGYDDACYGEYIRAVQDCEAFCNTNGIVFMPSTPFPLDTSDTIANSTTLRRDCGSDTASQLLISGVKNVLDFFSLLADPDNTFKAGFTYDGTHLAASGTNAITQPLIDAVLERFRTRNPIATITDPQTGEFIVTQPLDTISVDWTLDEGIPKNNIDQEILTTGVNIITRSGVTAYGFPYGDSVSIEYGEILQNQVNHYLCDSISTGLITDQEGNTNLNTYGNDALVGGYWDIRKAGLDYGRIFGSSSYFQDGNARSYSMWVKPTSSLNALHIFGQMPFTNANKNFIRTFTDGSLLFFIGNSNKSFGTLVVNQWTHIVWVFDGAGNDWAYVDNSMSTSRNHGTVAVSTFDVNVGASMNSDNQSTAGPTNGIDGQIRDIRILDRAISSAEVNYLYTNNF